MLENTARANLLGLTAPATLYSTSHPKMAIPTKILLFNYVKNEICWRGKAMVNFLAYKTLLCIT
jgi:hypothetical protein